MPAGGAARFLDRLAIIAAAIPGAVGALAHIRLQFWIVELRIVAPQAALDAAKIALHLRSSTR